MKKPRRPVAVGAREQELRPRRVRVLRPLGAERLDGQAERVDDRLVLVGVQRADGVDDRPAGLRPLGGRPQQLELQLGQRLRAPAEVGTAREHAEARARRVDERAVEAASSSSRTSAVTTRDVRRHLLGQVRGPARMHLDRGDLAGQQQRLPARRGTRIEDALAVGCEPTTSAASCEARLIGAHPGRVDPLDDVGARHVGRLADRLRCVHLERRRLVLRTASATSASSAPKSRVQTSAIQSGYDCLTGPSGSDATRPCGSPARAGA